MKITKVFAAFVFTLLLTLTTVVGVSAQDDTMKGKQTTMTKTITKTTHHRSMKKHPKMMAKHHRKAMHHTTKKTTKTETKSSS